MNSGKYVFAQVLAFVDRYEFRKCVERYNGDHRIRRLNCWNQFAQLLFGQLTGRNGLRDICLCLGAHKGSLYHFGIKQGVEQSTLSRANENRDWRIFADYGAYLIGLVRPMYTDGPIPGVEIDNDVFALDSTTISVSLILMGWAHGKYSRGAVKMHTIPMFIHISDGRYHDVNALDLIEVVANAVYVMDRAYLDFKRLFDIGRAGAFLLLGPRRTSVSGPLRQGKWTSPRDYVAIRRWYCWDLKVKSSTPKS